MAELAPPAHLVTARKLKGTLETPGSADNPVIVGWSDTIARKFPDLAAYSRTYIHDSIAWCGQFAAYCVSINGIRPPDGYLWARNWAKWGTPVDKPQLGDVAVFVRDGGGHVGFFEREDGNDIWLTQGNVSDSVNTGPQPRSRLIGFRRPPPPEKLPDAPTIPPVRFETLKKGDQGPQVALLQSVLPPWVDGDYGEVTEALVREFQRSEGLTADGVCGPDTWAALGQTIKPPGPTPLPVPPSVLFSATGKCSRFGGPKDTGVKADEGLAIFSKVEQAPHLFLPAQPPLLPSDAGYPGLTTGLARRLDPTKNYIACRWDYKQTPFAILRNTVARVRSAKTGIELEAYPADWGPNVRTGRVIDLSPGLMEALGIDTDDSVSVMFPAPTPEPIPVPTQPPPPTPEPPMPPSVAPPPTLPTQEFLDAYRKAKAAHPEEFAAARQSIGALLSTGLKAATVAFPQFAIFGMLGQFLLANAGIMGTAVGEATTPTGQVTSASLLTLLASWAISKVNKVTPK